MTHYDGIAIGGGPGGYDAALYAARLGKRIAIVEKNGIGGVCLHWGCIPTKTLVASAKKLLSFKYTSRYGLNPVDDNGFDWSVLHDHHRRVVDALANGLEKHLKSKGIDIYYGCGSLVDPKTVKVQPADAPSCNLTADRIFIATGSQPLPVPGTQWEDDWLIPGEDCFKWKELPKSILLLGGGVMGAEFACIYTAFGVEVHMIEILSQVLPGEDIDVARTIGRELKKIDVKMHLGKKLEKYERKNNKVIVRVEGGESVVVDKVLMCAGRKAITHGLDLEKAGIELDELGNIKTDKHNRTTCGNIYAVGDVSGPPLLAHAASYEGKIAALHAFTGTGENDLSAIPAGIYTIPEIGRVGLTEQKCMEMGIKYTVGIGQMRLVGRSHAEGETAGFCKIITNEKGKIIGACVLGKEAGEIIHILAFAMALGMTSREMEDKLIFSHPTLSEVVWEALKVINNPL